MIESFFSKKENVISEEQLKEYIEKEILSEAQAVFSIKELGRDKYYSGWIDRIKKREPFLVSLENGETEEVTLEPEFADVLTKLGNDHNSLRDFFMPPPGRSYAKVIPSENGNKYSLNQFPKETFTGRSISPEDIKEGMAAYFYSVLSNSKGKKEINNLVTALTTDKTPKISLPLEIDIDNVKVGPITSFILEQVKKANAQTFDAKSNNLLLNAVSCAIAMDSLIKSSKTVVIDRADLFKKYKRAASQLTRGNENKWCPADFFIYQKGMADELEHIAAKAMKSNSLVSVSVEKEVHQVGLNEAFAEDNKQRIVAVSLKEEDAQYGKAIGIVGHAAAVLNNNEINIVSVEEKNKTLIKKIESKTLVVTDAMIDEAYAELDKNKKLALGLMSDLGIKNILTKESPSEITENYDVIKEISLLLESGFKDFAEFIPYRKSFADKVNNGEEIKLVDGSSVQINKDVLSNLTAHGHDSKMLSRLYGGPNKGFPTTSGSLISVRQIDKTAFSTTAPATAKPITPAEKPQMPTAFKASMDKDKLFLYDTLIKKIECYRYLYSYISKFSKIKQMNSILATYDNPLLALTAYAVGLGGFNPTFYKVQGNITGEMASITKFEGQERLLMSSESATLVDASNYAGIKFFYVVNMGGEGQKTKLYETQLNFRFKGGAQMSIEVYRFKEK